MFWVFIKISIEFGAPDPTPDLTPNQMWEPDPNEKGLRSAALVLWVVFWISPLFTYGTVFSYFVNLENEVATARLYFHRKTKTMGGWG